MKVGLITGEATPITLFFRDRFQPDCFYYGCKDKPSALEEILKKTGSKLNKACYAPDGKFDIQIMKLVSFAACPANAIQKVKEISNIPLKHKGWR